mgnify:FL=1
MELNAQQAKNPDPATFQALFEQEYSALFGRLVEALEVEVTVWSVNATTPVQSITPLETSPKLTPLKSKTHRALFEPSNGIVAEAAEVLRSSMTPGKCIAGPAIITEDETTIIVPSSHIATALTDGCIDVIHEGGKL